ncbi:MAG: HU family DNA-binding protein, partial [Prevotellaceae bacterium]|nr:HU family DNA-binding protein [Prevotellaceae bacterium]
MEERVSLQELAQGLSRRKETTKREAESFLRTFFEVAEEFTLKEGVVRIKAFGTFKLLSVDSRQSVDISTGERIVIDPHSRVTFTPSTSLRDAVNKPFSEFQTVVLSDETPTSEMEYVPQEQPAEAPIEEPAEEPVEEPQAEEANPNNDMNEQEEQPQPAQQGVGGTTVVNQSVEEMQVNAQYVENQTIQQVVSSAVSEELAKRKRMMISRGGVVACVLAALLLMLAAFLLGYVCAGGTVSLGLKDKPQAVHTPKPQPKP